MKVTTPEEFKAKVKELIEAWADDPEAYHMDTDFLMQTVLGQLGYMEGVELIISHIRWYS